VVLPPTRSPSKPWLAISGLRGSINRVQIVDPQQRVLGTWPGSPPEQPSWGGRRWYRAPGTHRLTIEVTKSNMELVSVTIPLELRGNEALISVNFGVGDRVHVWVLEETPGASLSDAPEESFRWRALRLTNRTGRGIETRERFHGLWLRIQGDAFSPVPHGGAYCGTTVRIPVALARQQWLAPGESAYVDPSSGGMGAADEEPLRATHVFVPFRFVGDPENERTGAQEGVEWVVERSQSATARLSELGSGKGSPNQE